MDRATAATQGARHSESGDYTLDSAREAIRRGASAFVAQCLSIARRLKRSLDDCSGPLLRSAAARARGEEQWLKDLEFHGIGWEGPRHAGGFDLPSRWARPLPPMCDWWGRRERAKRSVPGPSPDQYGEPAQLAVCNCSAMVDTLLESKLFGPPPKTLRGSFTGEGHAAGVFE